MDYNLGIIGNVNIETEMDASQLPASGDFSISNISERIGGEAMDTSIISAHFGLHPSIFSSIGMDATGILEIMERFKIDYSKMAISDEKTGKHVLIRTPKETYSLLYEGANKHILSHGIDLNFLNSVKLVHICPCDAKVPEKILPKIKDPIVSCQFDPRYPDIFLRPEVDLLFVQGSVALDFTGVKGYAKAARSLCDKGPKTVVVNDGGRAAHICRTEDEIDISFKSQRSYDASHYFNSFIAGFISRFVKTLNYKSSASFGLAYQFFTYDAGKRVVFKDAYDVEELMYKIVRLNNE